MLQMTECLQSDNSIGLPKSPVWPRWGEEVVRDLFASCMHWRSLMSKLTSVMSDTGGERWEPTSYSNLGGAELNVLGTISVSFEG